MRGDFKHGHLRHLPEFQTELEMGEKQKRYLVCPFALIIHRRKETLELQGNRTTCGALHLKLKSPSNEVGRTSASLCNSSDCNLSSLSQFIPYQQVTPVCQSFWSAPRVQKGGRHGEQEVTPVGKGVHHPEQRCEKHTGIEMQRRFMSPKKNTEERLSELRGGGNSS